MTSLKEDKPLLIGRSTAASGAGLGPAVDILRQGGLVAYPTETFYGIAADPFSAIAVKSIFELKGRSESSPITLIIGDVEMLDGIVTGVPEQAKRLMERYWPGALTIVFNAAVVIPQELLAGFSTVGVRLPGCRVARELSSSFGGPITATSANPSGSPAPRTAKGVLEYFGASIEAVIDGGTLGGTLGSTIVDCTGASVSVIREGDLRIQI